MSLQISTLGVGGNISTTIPSRLTLTGEVGYTYFKFARNQYFKTPEKSEILLQPDFKHSILTGMVNWYPFKKKVLYFKSGLAYVASQRYFTRITSPTGLILGGTEISAEDFGQIDFNVRWNRLMPYLGLGFGKKEPKRKIDIVFNFGVFYMGSPKLDARFEGFLETTTLDTEIIKIQKNMSNYSYYPMLSANLKYKIM